MERGLALTWRRIPERYRLIGVRCETCGTNYFPVRNVCPKCRRKGRLVRVRYSGRGKVYSHTWVTTPPAGFELHAPYVLAIVELDEGPRITAQIVNAERGNVNIGDRVEVVFRKIMEEGKEGLIHYGFKFKLVEKD